MLRCVFGNPFDPPSSAIDPALGLWNEGTLERLALAAYEERLLPSGHLDAVRLAVLADALEDAGCAHADLLDACRHGDPDVDGVWAVRVLLAGTGHDGVAEDER